jgi:hypothetical protein
MLLNTHQLISQEKIRLGIGTQRSILTISDKPFSRAIPNFRIIKGDTLEIYLESKTHYKIFYKNKYGWINKRKVRELKSIELKNSITTKYDRLHNYEKQNNFLRKETVSSKKINKNIKQLNTPDKIVNENTINALFYDSKKRERIRYRVNKNLKRIGLYGLKIKFFNK